MIKCNNPWVMLLSVHLSLQSGFSSRTLFTTVFLSYAFPAIPYPSEKLLIGSFSYFLWSRFLFLQLFRSFESSVSPALYSSWSTSAYNRNESVYACYCIQFNSLHRSTTGGEFLPSDPCGEWAVDWKLHSRTETGRWVPISPEALDPIEWYATNEASTP